MKNTLTLTILLVVMWLIWSGHFDKPFIIGLGIVSCLFCVWLSVRMKIVDDEGAPVNMLIRPFITYFPWLAKEIVVSNIAVTKIICSPKMPLQRNLIEVHARQKTDLGKVILANSITLTPGTVSVNLEDDRILVHALSFEGAEEDLTGDMEKRVCNLEGNA